MPFVSRNADGRVVVLSHEPSSDMTEVLGPDHPDVVEFLNTSPSSPDGEAIEEDPVERHKQDLTDTDMSLIRAIEDLINILIEKGVIARTDLHPQLTELLERRQRLRRLVQEFGDDPMDDE